MYPPCSLSLRYTVSLSGTIRLSVVEYAMFSVVRGPLHHARLTRVPRYGILNFSAPLFCLSTTLSTPQTNPLSMVLVAGTKKPVACSEHAAETMVDVVNKKCGQPGCQKQPTHGLTGTRTREFCFAHAPPEMINLHIKMCGHAGCSKQRSHGVVGTQKREFCGEHAVEGMVSLLGKRCVHENCSNRPSHGLAGSREKKFCRTHAGEGMVIIPPTSRSRRTRARATASDPARLGGASMAASDTSPSPEQVAGVEQEQPPSPAAEDGSAASAGRAEAADERNPSPVVAACKNSSFIDQEAPIAVLTLKSFFLGVDRLMQVLGVGEASCSGRRSRPTFSIFRLVS